MAKTKKFKLKRKAWVEYDMMESEVYRSLSGKAMWVVQRFHQKMPWEDRKVPGSNRKEKFYFKDNLAFTYTEAEYFGISRSRFHRIIIELVEKGFIDVEYQGGCYGQDYSRYRISDRWRKWGTPEFKKVTKKRVLQPGLDVQSRKRAKSKKGTENRNP